MIPEIEKVIRLLISALLGGLIGMEREVSNRPAGLRTHILVSVGSTLIMLVSVDGFRSLGDGTISGDPARLAAQVISGIGFLGAGTIMRTGNSIKGLTTAASLWVCAGIGLAIGVGYYLGAIVTVGIVLIVLKKLGIFEKRLSKKQYKTIEVVVTNKPGIIGQIGTLFGKYSISIKDIDILENDYKYDEEDTTMEIQFIVKMPSNFDEYNFKRELYQLNGLVNFVYEGENITYNNINSSSFDVRY
ncbi:MAG: MgtC/SapB family protein [Tissierellia bacterium]|nr:MgtC/SapB family protein [Tissierellia bacterium]